MQTTKLMKNLKDIFIFKFKYYVLQCDVIINLEYILNFGLRFLVNLV
jgi:hypothetical protein